MRPGNNGGGNPNHDENGRFTSAGGASAGNKNHDEGGSERAEAMKLFGLEDEFSQTQKMSKEDFVDYLINEKGWDEEEAKHHADLQFDNEKEETNLDENLLESRIVKMQESNPDLYDYDIDEQNHDGDKVVAKIQNMRKDLKSGLLKDGYSEEEVDKAINDYLGTEEEHLSAYTNNPNYKFSNKQKFYPQNADGEILDEDGIEADSEEEALRLAGEKFPGQGDELSVSADDERKQAMEQFGLGEESEEEMNENFGQVLNKFNEFVNTHDFDENDRVGHILEQFAQENPQYANYRGMLMNDINDYYGFDRLTKASDLKNGVGEYLNKHKENMDAIEEVDEETPAQEEDATLKKVKALFENPSEYYNNYLPENSWAKKHQSLDEYLQAQEDDKKYGGPFSNYAGTYSDIFKDEYGYRPRGDYDGVLRYAAERLGVEPNTPAYEYLKQKMEEFKKFHNNSSSYSY